MLVSYIIEALETFAPRGFQESWDNTGWQVGMPTDECTGVLVCVDCTPDVVCEAKKLGCNLVVSHHPLLFKGLKRITGSTPVESTVLAAIKDGIGIYSCHTALDSVPGGVSYTMARKLGVEVIKTLSPLSPRWKKLSVMVPVEHAEQLRVALFDVGCGQISCGKNGEAMGYDCCSYNVDGHGTFRALEGSNPAVGVHEQLHTQPETKISMLVDKSLIRRAMAVIAEVHPYESPAVEIINLENTVESIGLGIYGTLEQALTPGEFIDRVKAEFGSGMVRHSTIYNSEIKLRRVAACGGSGGEFIGAAIAAGAQVYLSSDIRYHDFVDYQDRILLVDIGHFESEQCTKDIFYEIFTQKFANFAVYKSSVEKNPINYQ